jgi:hypothetical protein
MEIVSDRTFDFGAARPVLWAAVADVAGYRRLWPWLVGFDGARLAPGEVWACAVRPPVPYTLRFRITIDEVDPGRRVTATIGGDIRGRARLDLSDSRSGARVRLRSGLAPDTRWLAAVASLARPAVRLGHDWVLDTGARQFGERVSEPASAS